MEWFHYSTIYIMPNKIAQISIILIRISLVFQTSIYFMMMKTMSTYQFRYTVLNKKKIFQNKGFSRKWRGS